MSRRIERATAQIETATACRASAVLFTDRLLLTAGHAVALGQAVAVNFADEQRRDPNEAFVANAKVIERCVDRDKALDFAVLQLLRPVHRSRIPIRLQREWQTYQGSNCLIHGYRARIFEGPTSGFATLLGTVRPTSWANYWLNLEALHDDHLEGLSGAGIALHPDATIIGIQVSQVDEHRHLMIAMPVDIIAKHSRIVRQHLHGKRTPRFIHNLNAEAFIRLVGSHHRWILAATALSDLRSLDLEDCLAEEWGKFVTRLGVALGKLGPEFQRSTLVAGKNLSYRSRHREQFPEGAIGSALQQEFDWELNLRDLRAVLDLTSDDLTALPPEPDRDSIAMLMAVRIADAVNITARAGFEAVIGVPGDADPRQVIQKALSVIGDFLLEELLILGIPPLHQLIAHREGRRALDSCIAAFISSNSLTPYGLPAASVSPAVMCIAACARDSVGADLNIVKYRQLLRRFVNQHLAPSSSQRQDGAGRMSTEQIVAIARGWKGIGGQLGERSLRAAFSKAGDVPDGALCAVAIAIRRPRSEAQAHGMATFFGRQEWRAKMLKIVREADLPRVLAFQGYLRLFFFRYALGSPQAPTEDDQNEFAS